MGMAKFLRGSGKGSTEGKVEKVLLIGMGNLSRIVGKKPSRGGGVLSRGRDLSWAWIWSGSDQWWGLCYS
jgi:hypothetical protein